MEMNKAFVLGFLKGASAEKTGLSQGLIRSAMHNRFSKYFNIMADALGDASRGHQGYSHPVSKYYFAENVAPRTSLHAEYMEAVKARRASLSNQHIKELSDYVKIRDIEGVEFPKEYEWLRGSKEASAKVPFETVRGAKELGTMYRNMPILSQIKMRQALTQQLMGQVTSTPEGIRYALRAIARKGRR